MKKYLILTTIAIASLTACKTGTTIGKEDLTFLFGDYILNGPEDIQSTGFWQSVLAQCLDFAEHYNADGGNAKVVYLPDEGITGNSHFLFQEKNNDVIADYIAGWLKTINL